MERLRTFRRTLLVIAGVLIFGSCSAVFGRFLTVTEQGTVLERFIPADASLVAIFDTSVFEDREIADDFISFFGIPSTDRAIEMLRGMPRVLLPVIAQYAAPLPQFAYARIGAGGSAFAVALAEPHDARTTNLTGALQASGSAVETRGSSFYFENNTENIFGFVKKDVLFVADSTNLRDSVFEKKQTLHNDKKFKNLMSHLPQARAGYVYLPRIADFAGAMAFAVMKEEGGVGIETVAEAVQTNSLPHLDSVISAGQMPAFFFESSHFSEFLKLQWKLVQKQENVRRLFGEDSTDMLPLSDDVLSMLDIDFGILIEDQSALLPAFSLFLDFGTDREKKVRAMRDFDGVVSRFVETNKLVVETEQPYLEPLAESDSVKGVRLYPDRFPQEEFSIPLFANMAEPLELWYGATDAGLFFISTARRGEPKPDMKPIVNHAPYQALLPKLGTFTGTERVYIDPAPVVAWLTRAEAFAEEKGHIAQAERFAFEHARRILSSFKNIIIGTKQDGNVIQSRIFIAIPSEVL